jgi:DNA-binding response OmpR family regulator
MATEISSNQTLRPPAVRLLVIDDDVIQRTIISKVGAQSGYQVDAAATYEEAETLLKGRQYDCITLDLSLGEKSGALLIRTIVDSGNRVPVIVISGADEHVLRTTVGIAHSLDLPCEPQSKPLNLAKLRMALVAKIPAAVARRGNNQLAMALAGTGSRAAAGGL